MSVLLSCAFHLRWSSAGVGDPIGGGDSDRSLGILCGFLRNCGVAFVFVIVMFVVAVAVVGGFSLSCCWFGIVLSRMVLLFWYVGFCIVGVVWCCLM